MPSSARAPAATSSPATAEKTKRNFMGSPAEELDRPPQGIDQDVDFLGGIVNVEAGPGGAGEAELPHQRLIAVMAAAQGDAVLVGEGDDVVRVHVAEGETDQAAPFAGGAEQADAGQRAQLAVGELGERAIVTPDFRQVQGIEIVAGGRQGDRVAEIWGARLEAF